MDLLTHWHPVLLERALGSRPVRVVVAGEALALFQGADGPGALPDACPHRRMRLSDGRVQDGRLVCPYHGWRWAPSGHGESPGNPDLRPCADALEIRLAHGMVWVRRPGGTAPLPAVDTEGLSPVCVLERRVEAPLELALDNFCEVEHTPTVHAYLGYSDLARVRVETTADDASVRVYNIGPQRPVPGPLAALIGLEPGDDFVDDWTTRFSPVHCIYDQYWQDAGSGARRPTHLRIAVFFTPEGPAVTRLFVAAWARSPLSGRPVMGDLTRRLVAALMAREVELDARLLERLEDKGPELRGMKLGRFDRMTGLNRARLERIYHGAAAGASKG